MLGLQTLHLLVSIQTHAQKYIQILLIRVHTAPHAEAQLPCASPSLTFPRAVPDPDPLPEATGIRKTLEMHRQGFGSAVAFSKWGPEQLKEIIWSLTIWS